MRVLLLLALLGFGLAAPKTEHRIMGGESTTIDQYPFMGNVQYLFFGVNWLQDCAGSLLTVHSVLSAARCYNHDVAAVWRVILGSHYLHNGGTIYQLSQIIRHPQYGSPVRDNDVAILRLATPAQLSSTVRPARIAGPDYVVPDGAAVTAVGWGRLWFGGSYPSQLQRVEMNVVNREQCAQRYAFLQSQPGFEDAPDVTTNMLCFGIDVGGKGACTGDHGGPLLHQGDVIVGVLSWAHRCGEPGYPGVSARVNHYINWIIANV